LRGANKGSEIVVASVRRRVGGGWLLCCFVFVGGGECWGGAGGGGLQQRRGPTRKGEVGQSLGEGHERAGGKIEKVSTWTSR